MINIDVFSGTNVSIENQEYNIEDKATMIKFLEALLNKVYYGEERIIIEDCNIVDGAVYYTTIAKYPKQ